MAGKVVYLKKSRYEMLDSYEQGLLNSVKAAYVKCGADSQLANFLFQHFYQSSEPYVTALKLSYGSGDFHACRNKSLAVFIVLKLSEYIKFNTIEPLKDANVKLDALRLIVEQKSNFFRDLVIKVYNMPADKDIFVPFIQELLEKKKYKEACQLASVLRLHSKFSPEDLLLPLYVQDKLTIIQEYVSHDMDALKEFLVYMDQFLVRSAFDKMEKIALEKGITDGNFLRNGHKTLVKMMIRLMNLYKIPDTLCPNLTMRRKSSALHYLIGKRFESLETRGGGQGWDEMAMDAVGTDEEMQLLLVEGVFERGEPVEAVDWALRFNIPEEKWPPGMVLFKSGERSDVAASIPESPDPPEEVLHSGFALLELPFGHDKIIIVDTPEQLAIFFDKLARVDIVAIDSEWKPSLIKRNDLALIQVATRDEVFIIDRISLGQDVLNEYSGKLLDELFGNKKLLKLGFDFASDLRELQFVLPNVKEISNMLDMVTLRDKLKEKYGFKFPFLCDTDADAAGAKLKNLVEMCLNKTLDKSEQCSNWERRPLRTSQLNYAALDAFCLIEIYDTMRTECLKQNIPFQEIADELLSNVRSPAAKSKSEKLALVRPHDVHLICTWELALLHKRLRRCGMDVLYNGARQPSKCHMKLLLQKGYTLLTSVGQTWLTGKMKSIRVRPLDEQTQLRQVLKDLQVQMLPEDTISRCPECNETDIKEIATEDVKKIIEHAKLQAMSTTKGVPPEEAKTLGYDDDDYYDDDDDDFYEEPAHVPVGYSVQGPNRWTSKGVPMQFDKVPDRILDNFPLLFVCESCGHFVWPVTLEDMFLYD